MSTVEGWRTLVVPVEGPLRDVVISTVGHGLPDLQRHLYGASRYVTRTALPGAHGGYDAWVDDDGAVSDPPLPVNSRLTELAGRPDGWQLRGHGVITGLPDASGEITSLSGDDIAVLREAIGSER